MRDKRFNCLAVTLSTESIGVQRLLTMASFPHSSEDDITTARGVQRKMVEVAAKELMDVKSDGQGDLEERIQHCSTFAASLELVRPTFANDVLVLNCSNISCTSWRPSRKSQPNQIRDTS